MLQFFAVLLSLARIQTSAATIERTLSYLPAIISEDQQFPLGDMTEPSLLLKYNRIRHHFSVTKQLKVYH